MKNPILIYLVACLWVWSPLSAIPMQAFLAGSPPAAVGASYVEKDSNTGTQNGAYEVAGTLTTTRYMASKFLTGSAYNLNKVDIYAAKVGSPTNDFFCEIWTVDGSNLPGAQVGTTSAAVNGSTFATSEGVVSFYPTATLTTATEYFIVVWSATNSATDYVNWYRNTDGTVERIANTNLPATGWVGVATTRQCKFKTYGDS